MVEFGRPRRAFSLPPVDAIGKELGHKLVHSGDWLYDRYESLKYNKLRLTARDLGSLKGLLGDETVAPLEDTIDHWRLVTMRDMGAKFTGYLGLLNTVGRGDISPLAGLFVLLSEGGNQFENRHRNLARADVTFASTLLVEKLLEQYEPDLHDFSESDMSYLREAAKIIGLSESLPNVNYTNLIYSIPLDFFSAENKITPSLRC